MIGFAAGPIPSLPLNQVLLRNRTVVGVDWGAWAMQHGPDQQALLASLLDLVADRPPPSGRAPHLSRSTPSAEALDDLLGRRVVGKIALTP